MKIYDREGFPNPIHVRAVVAAKGLESQIEWVSVDLIAAEHKQPPFLAKNPSGVVPVLELDDGTFISESTAITEYLDNLDGNPILEGRSRGQTRQTRNARARAINQGKPSWRVPRPARKGQRSNRSTL